MAHAHKMFWIGAGLAGGGLFLQGCGAGSGGGGGGGSGASTTTASTTTAGGGGGGGGGGPVQHANYPADKLQYAGRWYDDGNNKVNGWGQQVTAKFTGSGSVGIYMNANQNDSPSGLYFSYKIDEGEWQKEKLLNCNPCMLQDDLEKDNDHTVSFGRSDEASDGTFTFMDWALESDYTALMLDTPDAAPLSYQAIGDSITAGYKSECNSANNGGGAFGVATTNVYNTYVRHLADHWGTTDWSTVARTGCGIIDNGLANHAMTDLYKCRQWYSLNECDHEWDFSSATSHPDVITINLGTNDFELVPPPGKEEYQDIYASFVSFVRSVHPDATIFCINPLEYSFAGPPDGAPPNKYTNMTNAIKDACENLNDAKIFSIATGSFGHSPLAPVGDNTVDWTHPTVEGHNMFAQFLIPLLTPVVRQNNPHVVSRAPIGFQVSV